MMMMFRITVCVILCFSISNVLCMTEEMKEVLDALHNNCQQQSGASEDLIKGAQTGTFVTDRNLQCYAKCLMLEMATISEDGIIDVEACIAVMPDEIRPKIEGAIRKCGDPGGADACEVALNAFKCVYENGKDYYFMP